MRSKAGHHELARRFDALADADADDPAVEELTAAFVAVFRDELTAGAGTGREQAAPLTELVFGDWAENLPPAQRRFMELLTALGKPPSTAQA